MLDFIKRFNAQFNPDSDYAAIDLGSNSFHMIVGRVEDNHIILVDELREMVSMASGLKANGELSEKCIRRCLECLARFAQRVKHIHHSRLRIVGTNTLRKARNSAEFLKRAEEYFDKPIEIVSGIEEARLIYLGVSHSISDNHSRQLVVDIGGGSTEIIIGENHLPITLESLHMGCVSMSKTYFEDGVFTQEKFYLALIHALMELEPHIKRFKNSGWEMAIGSSGTAKAIARLIEASGLGEREITLPHINELIDRVVACGNAKKLSLPGLKPDRVATLPGGLVIMKAIFKSLDISSMSVSTYAMREGILFDFIGRGYSGDVREESIERLMARYMVDREQAERVRAQALHLFDQVEPTWKLGDENRRMLTWAARVHEVGIGIAHSQYQKHGAYILKHSDLMGFSWHDQALLSYLVAAHRRRPPEQRLENFQSLTRKVVLKLTVLLRLAVLLNRARNESSAVNVVLTNEKRQIKLAFPDKWLEQHPLTVSDLELEQKYLRTLDYDLKY